MTAVVVCSQCSGIEQPDILSCKRAILAIQGGKPSYAVVYNVRHGKAKS